MIQIPDPSRLFPWRLPPSKRPGQSSPARDILSIGASIAAVLAALVAWIFLEERSLWLAVPAAFLAFGLTLAILEPVLLGGVIETVLYSCISFLLLWDHGKLVALLVTAAIFLFFAGMTYWAWKDEG